jgi:hypothetical protein
MPGYGVPQQSISEQTVHRADRVCWPKASARVLLLDFWGNDGINCLLSIPDVQRMEA